MNGIEQYQSVSGETALMLHDCHATGRGSTLRFPRASHGDPRGKNRRPVEPLVTPPRNSPSNHPGSEKGSGRKFSGKVIMPEVLQNVQLSVEPDLSGGVKLRLGASMALMSPDQAFEFAMVILEKIGVGVNIGQNVQAQKHRHFRPG